MQLTIQKTNASCLIPQLHFSQLTWLEILRRLATNTTNHFKIIFHLKITKNSFSYISINIYYIFSIFFSLICTIFPFQSFHGTAALEQLISSEEEEDLTLSADEGFSPPTPSPCELSPARASLRNTLWERLRH